MYDQIPNCDHNLEGDGIWHSGFFLSISNMIKLKSEGSTTPSVDNNDFLFVKKVLSTSRVDIAVGDWAKSSTML